MSQNAASRGIAPLMEERRKLAEENIRLRERCERLRKAIILTDADHCRCGACGGEWQAGATESHSSGCVAASDEPRASSSTQNSRGAASKRRR